jgi:hypothetical protein
MGKHKRFSVHTFSDLATTAFSPVDYSRLKFGCNAAALKFGYQLAEQFFAKHVDHLLSHRCVVIPSPYNHVKNAATIMTEHFVNRLNELLVISSGEHVEATIIHRKVSYTNDYGFLSKEKRKGLLSNDSFYVNRDFVQGKTLIFIDDVRITGTHEEKLVEIMDRDNLDNDAFFLYFANYSGNSPDIEAALNFSGMKNVDDYIELATSDQHHVIVRPIKYLLGLAEDEFTNAIQRLPESKKLEVYFGCLGEGYFRIPNYQVNFARLKEAVGR